MIESIDQQRYPALGLLLETMGYRFLQNAIVCGKARSLGGDRTRIGIGQPANQTANNAIPEDARLTLFIGISQEAVVLGDQPSFLG